MKIHWTPSTSTPHGRIGNLGHGIVIELQGRSFMSDSKGMTTVSLRFENSDSKPLFTAIAKEDPEQIAANIDKICESVPDAPPTLDSVHREIISFTKLHAPQKEQADSLGHAATFEHLPDWMHDSFLMREQAEYAQRLLTGEVGEIADLMKRWLDYGKGIKEEAITEELSDVLFSIVFFAEVFQVSLSDLARKQIEKLRSVFGKSWSKSVAAARKSDPGK